MMNCEQYREAIAADPAFDGGAGHLAGCADCKQYRQEILALNETIGRALAIEVPDLVVPELPDVSTENVVRLADRRRVSTPAWLAMAATVALAAVLGIRMLGTSVEYESLGDEILAHLPHEPQALRVTDVPVTDKRLKRVVAADVAQFDRSASLITYAQTCVINGHRVPHLVVQGERGPITILLMPEEMVSGPSEMSDAYNHGVILPVGNGSIAIIGEQDEQLDEIERTVLNSVMWST